MSITDTNSVDMIGTVAETNTVVLSISDHLKWDEREGEHLMLLQEKINTYLRFIESGEIFITFPNAKGKSLAVRIYLQYEPSQMARDFLEKAVTVLYEAGIELQVDS
jgi:CRP-like cAMP-binding protein